MSLRRSLPMILVSTVAALVAPASHTLASPHAPVSAPRRVPFRIIHQSGFPWIKGGPCVQQCYKVITSQQALDRFWNLTWPGTAPPTEDFAHHAIVVTGWGVIGNGGSCCGVITVSRVVRVGTILQVHVRRTPVPPSNTFNVVLSYPTALTEVPRSFSRAQFIVQTDGYGCTWQLVVTCNAEQPPYAPPTALITPHLACHNPVRPDTNDIGCYGPSNVAKAEALIRPHSIDPSTVIGRLTHLRLHRVLDVYWAESITHRGVWQPHYIEYVYGSRPPAMDKLDLSRPHPSFVTVMEGDVTDGTFLPRSPGRLQRLLLHLNTGDPTQTTTIVPGPWEYVAGVSHRSIGIDVVADGKRSSVRAIGQGLLQALG